MSKFERIVRLRAISISRENAEQIAALMHELAEARVTALLEERLRAVYRQIPVGIHGVGGAVSAALLPAPTEAEYVAQNALIEPNRAMFRPAFGDKYTFLSPTGNIEFLYDDFEYTDIPPDVDLLLAEAHGANGEIVGVTIKAKPDYADLRNPNMNRILIQGESSAWVNDTYERMIRLLQPREDVFRTFFYRWMTPCIWATFLAIVAIEYRALYLFTSFNWRMQLNGLQLLVCFAVLSMALIVSAQLYLRLLHHLYPYFELEGKISKRRVQARWPIRIGLGILYSAAISSLFGPK